MMSGGRIGKEGGRQEDDAARMFWGFERRCCW